MSLAESQHGARRTDAGPTRPVFLTLSARCAAEPNIRFSAPTGQHRQRARGLHVTLAGVISLSGKDVHDLRVLPSWLVSVRLLRVPCLIGCLRPEPTGPCRGVPPAGTSAALVTSIGMSVTSTTLTVSGATYCATVEISASRLYRPDRLVSDHCIHEFRRARRVLRALFRTVFRPMAQKWSRHGPTIDPSAAFSPSRNRHGAVQGRISTCNPSRSRRSPSRRRTRRSQTHGRPSRQGGKMSRVRRTVLDVELITLIHDTSRDRFDHPRALEPARPAPDTR